MKDLFVNWCLNEGREKLLELSQRSSDATDLQLDSAWEAWQAAYHLAFAECAVLMDRYVDEKWVGRPGDVIRGSEKLTGAV